MADIIYTVNQDTPENITGFEQYSQEDRDLVNSFQINNIFNPTKNYSELHILSLSDELLESVYDYRNYKQSIDAQSAGQEGTSTLTIDPVADSKAYGYETGGVKLLYHFLDDLYSEGKAKVEFYIQDISADRTELSLTTLNISSQELETITSAIKTKLESQSYFTGFRLNFKENDLLIATNIDTLASPVGRVVVVKLYEPLPALYRIKSVLSIAEIVSDSIAYEIDTEFVTPPVVAPTLKSPNFNISTIDYSVVPTSYYNYNELFSYPINNTNSQLFSTVNEKSIEISVDYTDFSDFVHFSSIQERLLNFKYKVDLINSYSASIASGVSATTGLQAVSGSRDYFQKLLTGVVSNFDHYERFLYFESGSNSWPKSNNTKPYNNKVSTEAEAITWYTSQIAKAVSYDNLNYNSLAYSIPTYLRDDANNENYLTFIYMVGQHFDNLWLYSKAVTDKYDADNRVNKGISKDLVAEALKNFGVKLYTSNKSIEDLFTTFIGQAYQSGSEKINVYVTGSLTGSNTPIQPTSYDNYQKEVQKRIYHNLPLLLKSKGTERGLRALINCFGIPSDILDIKIYGGRNINERPFYGDYRYFTSSLDKVRPDNTGSITSGSTLSQYTSIVNREYKYTDDLHPIEIGFSPTDNVDNYIISKSLSTGSLASFNIDDYLGDPRNLYQDNYYTFSPTGSITSNLSLLTNQIMSGSTAYNVQDFVRLIKFFDNTIFKMVKDFIPARSTADTGIIIKPHILGRSKAKSVELEGTRPEYTGSIDTAFISGSDGGSFGGESTYTTSYLKQVQTPLGIADSTQHLQAQSRYDGEFSGSILTVSTGELNPTNPFKYNNPVSQNLYVTLIQDFPNNICVISPSYSPLSVTSHDPRNVALDFTSLGISGVTFISASTDITPQVAAFTFPTTNYQQHIISASNNSLVECSGSIIYTTAYCDLANALTSSIVVISGSGIAYNLNTWISTGSNTNTSYTASWGVNIAGITNSGSYVFTQPTGSVTITRKDNIIAGCSYSIDVSIVEALENCITLSQLKFPKPNPEQTEGVEYSYSYIPCFGGAGGVRECYTFISTYIDSIALIDTCIVSGSLTVGVITYGPYGEETCLAGAPIPVGYIPQYGGTCFI